MDVRWRIEMLGGLRAVSADRVLTRFRSHKTGALLAYLSFHVGCQHPRDLFCKATARGRPTREFLAGPNPLNRRRAGGPNGILARQAASSGGNLWTMLPGTQPTPLRRARTVRVLWAALVIATLIYALLAFLLRRQGVQLPHILPPPLIGSAPLLALLIGGIGLVLAWFLGTVLGPRPAGSGSFESRPSQSAWPKIQSATLIVSAIAEWVAVMGLLFFFLGLPFPRFLLFIGLSLLIHAVNFIRLQGWIGEELRRAPM
jgi:hypothetical protein